MIFDFITLFELSNKLIKTGINSSVLIFSILFLSLSIPNNKQFIIYCWFFWDSFSITKFIESIFSIKHFINEGSCLIICETVLKALVLISWFSQSELIISIILLIKSSLDAKYCLAIVVKEQIFSIVFKA